MLLGLELARILLLLVAHLGPLGMAEVGVVVEGDLAVERHHLAALGDHQRVDLEQRAILAEEALVERVHQLGEGLHRVLLAQSEREGDLPHLERCQPEQRIDVRRDDLLGMGGSHFLDLHAALGRGDDRDATLGAIDQHGQVELARDVEPLLDVQPPDLLPLGAGLLGHELHAEHLRRRRDGRSHALAHLDPAALATPAGVDLGFDDHDLLASALEELLGDGLHLVQREGGLALGNGCAVAREQLLGLVFVQLHDRKLPYHGGRCGWSRA